MLAIFIFFSPLPKVYHSSEKKTVLFDTEKEKTCQHCAMLTG
jgi:hypothetical protein